MDDDHLVSFASLLRHSNPVLIVLREAIPGPGLDLPADHKAVRFVSRPENNMVTGLEWDWLCHCLSPDVS